MAQNHFRTTAESKPVGWNLGTVAKVHVAFIDLWGSAHQQQFQFKKGGLAHMHTYITNITKHNITKRYITYHTIPYCFPLAQRRHDERTVILFSTMGQSLAINGWVRQLVPDPSNTKNIETPRTLSHCQSKSMPGTRPWWRVRWESSLWKRVKHWSFHTCRKKMHWRSQWMELAKAEMFGACPPSNWSSSSCDS